MGVPGTLPGLLILIVFVLPGFVYQATRSRLRGPTPDELDATARLLRAAAVSTALVLVTGIAFGEAMVAVMRGDGWLARHVRVTSGVAVVLVFVVPLAIAVFEHGVAESIIRVPRAVDRLRLSRLTSYNPVPSAWDFSFARAQSRQRFVRVRLTDGRWVGGWFDGGSYATSYPQPRELFIRQQYEMNDDGSFGAMLPDSDGVYVRCEDARVVEFLSSVEP